MPEELVAIIIIISVFTFVVTVVRSSHQYRLKKLEREAAGPGESLTTSELQEMIGAAVDDAAAPIREKINLLSARLDEVEGVADRLELPENEGVPEKAVGWQGKQRQH